MLQLFQAIYIGPQEIHVLKSFTYCRIAQELLHLNDTQVQNPHVPFLTAATDS